MKIKAKHFLRCRFSESSVTQVLGRRKRVIGFSMFKTRHTALTTPPPPLHPHLLLLFSGSDVTPNYSDSSPSNITISLWCTCRGTGGQEPECEAFHRDFTHNTCLSECRPPAAAAAAADTPQRKPLVEKKPVNSWL